LARRARTFCCLYAYHAIVYFLEIDKKKKDKVSSQKQEIVLKNPNKRLAKEIRSGSDCVETENEHSFGDEISVEM
jgi:hypothetical protein